MTAIPGTTNVFDAFACGRNEGRRERETIKSENRNLQAENERLRAEIARMHKYILDSDEARRHYWKIASERGREIERMRLALVSMALRLARKEAADGQSHKPPH